MDETIPETQATRILVIDDEQPIRHLVSEALTKIGWEVDAAANADEALRMIREKLYHAAIIDFALPDMDGIRLHSEIRRLDSELAEHTLFMSGVEQSDDRLKYYADSGGFLAKPFDIRNLIRRMREIVGT